MQPTPVFLPGECQGWWSLMGCRLWGRTESDTTEATQQQQLPNQEEEDRQPNRKKNKSTENIKKEGFPWLSNDYDSVLPLQGGQGITQF